MYWFLLLTIKQPGTQVTEAGQALRQCGLGGGVLRQLEKLPHKPPKFYVLGGRLHMVFNYSNF